jgi:TonB family protein
MKRTNRILISAIVLCAFAMAQPSERQVLNQTTPEYPALLKKLGIGGTVKLSASVSADGTVRKAKIDGGNPMLGEVACGAVKKWKFAPATQPSTEPVEILFDSKSASVTVK